jgi:hypothetical protein
MHRRNQLTIQAPLRKRKLYAGAAAAEAAAAATTASGSLRAGCCGHLFTEQYYRTVEEWPTFLLGTSQPCTVFQGIMLRKTSRLSQSRCLHTFEVLLPCGRNLGQSDATCIPSPVLQCLQPRLQKLRRAAVPRRCGQPGGIVHRSG